MKLRSQISFAVSKEKIVYLLTILFPLLILYNAAFKPWLVHPERALFAGCILVIVILLTPLKNKSVVRGRIYSIIDLILITISIACALHMILDWRYIVTYAGTPRPIDVAFGIMAVLVSLEVTRRVMLPLLPICLVFLLYAIWGHHLPGLMAAPSLSIVRLTEHLYLTTQGLFGISLNVILKYVLPFLIMGCLLKATGAMDVLSDLARIVVGRTVGGPAKIAVITSSLFGMISGSSVANVAFTGTFTIPLMKRYGYKPEFAGGVEACASTGGQLMPPIMGVAAFFMADYLGVPYVRIMLIGFIPAFLYYIAIFLRVHYQAKQAGLLRPSADIVGKVSSFREIIPRLIPLVIVFVVLMIGLFTWTPTRAALLASMTIIPVSFLRRETRLTPTKILAALRDSTLSFRAIGGAVMAFGILIGVATQTGLGVKFSELMILASYESLSLLLLATAAACLVMGMGVAGIVVYVFAAVMLAPALVKLGVPLLQAHFFVFYFAQIQSITPPVCMCSYAAASIAGADLTKTALKGCSIGFMAWIVPFLFTRHPELLLMGNPTSIIMTFMLMAVGLAALTFAIGGYINSQLRLWERILFGLLGFAIFVGWNWATNLATLVGIGVLIFVPMILKRRSQTSKI